MYIHSCVYYFGAIKCKCISCIKYRVQFGLKITYTVEYGIPANYVKRQEKCKRPFFIVRKFLNSGKFFMFIIYIYMFIIHLDEEISE